MKKIERNENAATVIEVLCEDIEKLCEFIESRMPEYALGCVDFRDHVKQARCLGSIRGLVLTTAPQAYDYDYVIEVDPAYGTFMGKTVRLVAIPFKSIEYQCGRYASGLYLAVNFYRAEEVGVEVSSGR